MAGGNEWSRTIPDALLSQKEPRARCQKRFLTKVSPVLLAEMVPDPFLRLAEMVPDPFLAL
jgi:hypothetical protein